MSKGLGLFFSSAVLAGGLAASGGAQAHVPGEGPQHDLMEPFKGTIMHMRQYTGGSCCDMKDAAGNLEEERYRDERGLTRYRVKVTHDHNGKALEGGPRWLDVPPQHVLDDEHIAKVCEEIRSLETPPADAETCLHPPFNVLWWLPAPPLMPFMGMNGRYGYKVEDTVLCYIPRPVVR